MSYLDSLAAAVRIAGYETYLLAGVQATHPATLADAVAEARREMQGQSAVGDWTSPVRQLQALGPLGVTTVSLRYEYVLHVVLTRNNPRQASETAQETVQFFGAMQTWLHTFQQALPPFRLSDDSRRQISGAWTSLFGQGGTAAAGLGLLLALSDAGSGVSCTVLVPIGDPVNGAFRAAWTATDLVSEPLQDPDIRIWAWDTVTQEMLLPGRSWAESDDPIVSGSLRHDQLSLLLRQVG